MRTQLFPADRVKEAASLIRKGGLVVFPTETVYGLGASAFNPGACVRIFSAKGRPSDNPLIVHVASDEQLAEVASLPPQAEALARAFWPGRECGSGVAAPSANVSGAPSPTTFEMAKGAMLGRVEGILMGEDCEEGLESTIVGFVDGQAKIFRPGSVTATDIAAVLGVDAATLAYVPPAEGRPVSPGMKYKHYKPHADVKLFRSAEELPALAAGAEKFGVLAVGIAPELPDAYEVRAFADWKEYGRRLYSSFFDLDQLGCTLILAQLPEAEGVGAAIANRLNKAAGTGS